MFNELLIGSATIAMFNELLIGSATIAMFNEFLIGSATIAMFNELLIGSATIAMFNELLIGSATIAMFNQLLIGSATIAMFNELLIGSATIAMFNELLISMGRKLHVQNSSWDHSLSGNRLIDSPRINTFTSYQCQHQLSIILTHAPYSRRSRIYLRINYYTEASIALENNILLKRRTLN